VGIVTEQATNLIGVKIKLLKEIYDERGFVKHMLRSDSSFFTTFGEVYFSFIKPNIVKGWKCHKLVTQNMAVPQGVLRLVLFDPREGSPSKGKLIELVIGDGNYCLVQIPPGIVYGFQSVSKAGALIANCIDMPHQPDESIIIPIDSDEIPYCWNRDSEN